MATLNLVVRTSLGRSYGFLRRGFFGSASVLKKRKDPVASVITEEKDLGDIVRDDSVKAAERDDLSDNFSATKQSEASTAEQDFGDIVRDDQVKSIHMDAETNTSSEKASNENINQINSSSPFSIDDMLLESATDSGNDDDDDDDDYYYYDSEDDMKRQILNSALEYVPEHGWTDLAIQKGAEVEGLSSSVEGLFPKGAGDLVLHFIEECNVKLAEQLLEESRLNTEAPGAVDISKRSTTEFVQDAIMLRLSSLQPYIHTWPQAVRLLMHPENAPAAMESLAHMVDEVWYHAGDTSTDFNWYTKRGVLAAIYGASEIYMTQDTSMNFEGTRQFVKNRLENANQLKKATLSMEQAADTVCGGFSMILSTAQNMLGYNCRRR